jgi:endoglucanase Acf2
MLCSGGLAGLASAEPAVKVGLGGHETAARRGDPTPPKAEFRGGKALGKAAPTNQWYSSVMFQRWSQPIHAHPMSYRATAEGFELGLPVKRVATVDGAREVKFAHTPALVVSLAGQAPQDARLTDYSDWLAQVTMASSGGAALQATVLHGSPFSYYEATGTGDVKLRLPTKPDAAPPARGGIDDDRVAVVAVGGRHYAVFAPTGATLEWTQPTELSLRLPEGKRYFSIAGLPNGNADTVREFLAAAYAFPTDTRVEWAYDEKASKVRSTFRVETVAKEGDGRTTLMGIYPHQWPALAPAPTSKHGYDTVRGRIRLVSGNSFTLERDFHGVIPMWGALEDEAAAKSVGSLMVGDLAKSDQLFTKMGRGTYWVGKGLGAAAQLMSVAEVQGDLKTRDKLLETLKSRLEAWFSGERATYFYHDAGIGSLLGVPQEYNSITNMNDHHFHYGYWVMAAAHVAMRDPQWASQQQWGAMVEKVIADIATPERGRTDFPFLRNYDPYEGHSWASGDADFDDGNNQESSSEAINAWAGLVLWGEATGNKALRDLGVYLYTSEIASIRQYWFDDQRQVLDPEYGKPFASMVFGGKYAYNTWWTQEPRQIFGINLLPITPASSYLANNPAYMRAVIEALPAEVKAYQRRGLDDGTPADIWQDVIASYAGLADADLGFAQWNRKGSVEAGDTRTRTLYWLSSLKEMGSPDFSVTADTPLFAVFKKADGTRTYLAYNARSEPIRVTFSSGKVVEVPAKSLVRTR